jgi:N-carbamoyl-L-amino-acid hydrolase
MYEHSPWIAERRWRAARSATLAQLKHAMVQVLRAAGARGAAGADPRPPRARRQGHGQPATLTAESTDEQKRPA